MQVRISPPSGSAPNQAIIAAATWAGGSPAALLRKIVPVPPSVSTTWLPGRSPKNRRCKQIFHPSRWPPRSGGVAIATKNSSAYPLQCQQLRSPGGPKKSRCEQIFHPSRWPPRSGGVAIHRSRTGGNSILSARYDFKAIGKAVRRYSLGTARQRYSGSLRFARPDIVNPRERGEMEAEWTRRRVMGKSVAGNRSNS
jgi:hypothetical protein